MRKIRFVIYVILGLLAQMEAKAHFITPVKSDDHFEVLRPESRRVRQPIHEYFTVMETVEGARIQSSAQTLNPFVSYTHLGSDFGFIGEVSSGLGWEVGKVKVDFPGEQWGGIWHSLEGLAMEKDKSLNLHAIYPSFIAKKFQPKVVGIELKAQGQGAFKLELKDSQERTVWEHQLEMDSPDMKEHILDLPLNDLREAKLLNWIAQPGSHGAVDRIAFIVEMPPVDYDLSVFVSSLVKLSRSYHEATGLVKDRAHTVGGEFDNVPASGFLALGLAVGAHHGVVELGYAKKVVKGIIQRVSEIPSVRGILPHFVKWGDQGRYEIVPGTEYSTVDTSLYYHAALLACEILEDAESLALLQKQIDTLNLAPFMDAGSFITHGLRPDGLMLLPSVWKDWGGESALVLAMGAFGPRPVEAQMAKNGKVHEGIGFIAEIQSLFYPQFDLDLKDGVTQQNWRRIRTEMLESQKAYFSQQWPNSRASILGLYGLSAGEARLGQGYMVSGVGLPQQSYIHPHYVLLSAVLEPESSNVYEVLRRMEAEDLYPPYGLVENFHRDLEDYLAMQGALNAGFETIGAYHLLVKHRKQRDIIYEAARAEPMMIKAMERFYPPNGHFRAASANKVGKP